MEIIKWLVTSSADPQKYSLTIKGALGMGLAYVIKVLAITCTVGLYCVAFDTNLVGSVVDTVGSIVYFGLSLVGGIAFLWGLGRKIWLNRISAYVTPPANLPTL